VAPALDVILTPSSHTPVILSAAKDLLLTFEPALLKVIERRGAGSPIDFTIESHLYDRSSALAALCGPSIVASRW
jgi:hypothetical protein